MHVFSESRLKWTDTVIRQITAITAKSLAVIIGIGGNQAVKNNNIRIGWN